MAVLLSINGPAGTGKSFGIRTLDPTKTVYVDCDGKGMPILGWKKDYNAANKNYFKTDDIQRVKAIVQGVNDKMLGINVIVVDTMTSAFEQYMFELRKVKSFDKWTNLSNDVYDFMKFCNNQRDDLIIILLNHTELTKSVNAQGDETQVSQIAIAGAKTKKEATITKLLNFSFYTMVTRSEETNEASFKLQTINNGATEARSIHGMFEAMIDNDYKVITDTIREKYISE